MPYIVPAYNPDPQRKPQFPCAVDWNHPLSRGLVGCFLFNEYGGYPHDLITLHDSTFVGAPLWTGRGLNSPTPTDYPVFSASSTNRLRFTTEEFTLLIRFKYRSTIANYDSYIHKTLYPSAGYVIGTNLAAAKDIYYAQSLNATTWQSQFTGSLAFSANELMEIVAVRLLISGVYKVDFYKNGNILYNGRTTSFGVINWTTEQNLIILGGDVIHSYIFNRALTPSEIQQLYIEPYCFILPC